jgi:molecular chaperone DnaK
LSDSGLSTSDIDEVILVGGMTRMPKVIEVVSKFFNKTPYSGVNPDEAVAMGAAIQAGVLQGDVKDVLLLDVTPLSLGIETLGGVFTRLIDRNMTIPTKKSQVFSTADDGQTAVTIRVFQGEREMAADNKMLACFNLESIPPSPRGMPQIEVTFDIDANGIVNVFAKDKATGKEHKVTVAASGGLSEEEIERMVQDAQKNAEGDKRRREFVELKNQADTAIHSAEKSLGEHGDKVSESEQQAIRDAIEKVKEASNSDDITKEALSAVIQELAQASMKLGEAMYAEHQKNETGDSEGNASGYNDTGGDANSESVDGDVIDAEFEEIKSSDKKKG